MIKKKAQNERNDDNNGFAKWGGYMAAKKAKLEEQFLLHVSKGNDDKISEIFKGIAIFVNGYTVPTANELKRIMMLHGGIYHHYECSATTHIIASNLPDVKIKQLKTLNVVKPSWIVDSVAAGRLLDYRKFLLYSNQTRNQPQLNFQKAVLASKELKSPGVDPLTGNNSESCKIDSIPCKGKPTISSTDTEKCRPQDDKSTETINCKAVKDVEDNEKTCTEILNIKVDQQMTKNSISSPMKTKNAGSSRRTASEPQFLSEFYSNSRLHHLSTMGAMFKDYVSKLHAESKGDFPGIKRLIAWKKLNCNVGQVKADEDDFVDDLFDESFLNGDNKKTISISKTIMHIDMDCFFVSVGLRNRPDLVGFPVAVTHAKGNSTLAKDGADRQFEREFYQERFQKRIQQKQGVKGSDKEIKKHSRLDAVGENDSLSEIASCNYEARKAGVKNGMFFGAAIKLCPNLKTIPYDFEGYKDVSYKLYDILASYTLAIEAVSCDEMFVDCTEILKKAEVTVLDFASFLRAEIKEATGCTASAGFGSNPLQARLATKKAKPNGQFHLSPVEAELFMHNVKVEDLPGVGYSLAYRLHAEGIATCRDLQRISLASLQKKFGAKTGEVLHLHARGEDNRTLDVCHQRKSVSAGANYGIRFTCQEEAETFLKQLAEEVVARMQQARVKGAQVTLKLMIRAKDAPVETAKYMGHGACDSISRSASLGAPTDDVNVIYREVLALERHLKVSPSDLRGVGIQVNRLVNLGAKPSKNTLLSNFWGRNKTTEGKNREEKRKGQKEDKEKVDEDEKPLLKSVEEKGISRLEVLHPQKCAQNENSCKSNFKTSPTKKECTKEKNVCRSDDKECPKEKQSISTASSHGFLSGHTRMSNSNVLPVLSTPIEVPMMTLTQARKLIRVWVSSETNPQKCDVDMFASYIQKLILARHLEDVDILLSMLHRLLINKGETWKTAYGSIIRNTQITMQAVYEANLQVPEFDM